MIGEDKEPNSDHEELSSENDQHSEGEIIDETDNLEGSGRTKVRQRIRVRKRIRIRKKPSVKKKLRKYGEKALWVVIVVGFITALIIMVIELDIRDDRLKKAKTKAPVFRSNQQE